MIFIFTPNNSLKISLSLKSSYKIIKRFHPIKPPKPPILGTQGKNPITKDINKGGQMPRQPSGRYSGCFRKIRREHKLPPQKEKQDVFKKPGIKKSDFEPIRDRRPMPMPTPAPNLQSTTTQTPTSSSSDGTIKNQDYRFLPLKMITNLTKSVVTKIIPSYPKNEEVQVENPVLKTNPPTTTTNEQLVQTVFTKTFMNHNGVNYTTIINESTPLDSLTDEQLENELFKRQLIKQENKHTINVTTENGDKINLAVTKNTKKLTPIGVMYHKKIKEKENVNENNKVEISDKEAAFFIATPPSASDDTFIEVPEQKHLLVAYEQSSDSYYALGYLTKKPSAFHVNDVLFHKYQKGDFSTSSEIIKNINKQYFVAFENVQRISKIDLLKVKNGDKYIEFSGKYLAFKNLLENLKEKPFVNYNSTGVTRQEALSMCTNYDKNVDSKGKHPHQNKSPEEFLKTKKENIDHETDN